MGELSEPQTKKARQLRMNAASGPAGVVQIIGIENANQVNVSAIYLAMPHLGNAD
jgi:hypothetical protein